MTNSQFLLVSGQSGWLANAGLDAGPACLKPCWQNSEGLMSCTQPVSVVLVSNVALE